MKKQGKIKVYKTVDDFSPYEVEGTTGGLLELATRLIEKYGPDANIDYDKYFTYPYEQNPSPRFNIIVTREETDEEYAARLQTEAEFKAAQVERDRKEFERLSKQFGKTK